MRHHEAANSEPPHLGRPAFGPGVRRCERRDGTSAYLLGICVPHCPVIWNALIGTSCPHLLAPGCRGYLPPYQGPWLFWCSCLFWTPILPVQGCPWGSSWVRQSPHSYCCSCGPLQRRSARTSPTPDWEGVLFVRPEMKEKPGDRGPGSGLFKLFSVGLGREGALILFGGGGAGSQL